MSRSKIRRLGTNEYGRKRVPAWCDRILWITPPHPCINIKQEYYNAATTTPLESDHRPVFSQFHISYNNSWNPNLKSQWLITIRNLKLYLYPFLDLENAALTTLSGSRTFSNIDDDVEYSKNSVESKYDKSEDNYSMSKGKKSKTKK